MKLLLFYLCKIFITVIATTTLVHFGLRLATGNPDDVRRGVVSLGTEHTTEEQADGRRGEVSAAQHEPHTVVTLVRGYPRWLVRMILFRFEPSFYSRLSPAQLISEQIVRTTLLALVSFAFSLLCAVFLALLCVRWNGWFIDTVLRMASQIIIIVPEFWLALMLLFCFAVAIPLFPLFGSGSLSNYVLPVLALTINRGMVLFSLLGAAMKREAIQDYVSSAQLRGVSLRRIAFRYQLHNSFISLIPVMFIQFGYLFGGAVIVEQVFSISGFGSLFLQALQRRDYPVAEGCVYVVALIFALFGAVGDVLSSVMSPSGSIDE